MKHVSQTRFILFSFPFGKKLSCHAVGFSACDIGLLPATFI